MIGHVVDAAVDAAPGQQLLVGALFAQLALVQHHREAAAAVRKADAQFRVAFDHAAGDERNQVHRIVEELDVGLVHHEQDLGRDVAAFFAGQDANLGQTSDEDAELLARGEELYRAGDMSKGIPACSACHTPTGVGIGSAVYPALSGQHVEYTISTLQDFASGERTNSPNNLMGDIASKMSDRDMEAVANYVLGLN